ncbi:MAG: hypothetical protein PVH40_08875 [Gemmatimonadales bacterium]
MGRKRSTNQQGPTALDQARDELYSHILRCGVLQATPEHQKEWFDDTIEYMAERYPSLSEEEVADLRLLGERYCQPVISHDQSVAATN